MGLTVAIWAGLTQFGIQNTKRYAWIWVVLYIVDRLLARLRQGTVLREYTDAFERVNSNLAGATDDLARFMRRSHGQRIGQDEAHALVVKLLACIRDYATAALQLGTDHMVRVSLAVPLEPTDPATNLRVWCYDDSHRNRRWSVLEHGWHGAPRAYETGDLVVLDDVNEERQRSGIEGAAREFKSVACIPVQADGIVGRPLGIVSIDVRERAFFTVQNLRSQLLPLVAPAVSQVGVVLTVMEEGAYEFER